jgi:hypothetical protein
VKIARVDYDIAITIFKLESEGLRALSMTIDTNSSFEMSIIIVVIYCHDNRQDYF